MSKLKSGVQATSRIYAVLTDRGAELEAAALATGVPVTLSQFCIGDANGQEEVTPDPARTELIHEVYRGNISASKNQDNQVTFTLDVPTTTGGYTIREVGILTDGGELYSVARSPDILKPTESNGAVISITYKYTLAVSSTSTISVVVYSDYLTPDAADKKYLQIGENLSEIASNGDAAKTTTRNNIGIVGDIAYRDKENTFTKKNVFNEIMYADKSIVLSGDWPVSWSLSGAYIEAYRNTSMVLVNTTGDFDFTAADSAGNNPLKVSIGGKRYNVYNEANLKPVLSVNNVKPDANGNVTVAVSGDGSTSSKTPNGWRRNADGTIRQWGTCSMNTTVNFPVPFPTECASVQITILNSDPDDSTSVHDRTSESFKPYNYWADTGVQVMWGADGY
ncbi:hypothetical protein FNO19_09880 [Salmonella enterica subsp. salamae]|nr:hypothetical protein [Salmonella enterica subsp. salamae]SQH40211.1 phage tail fiber protein [Salmonella enterica]